MTILGSVRSGLADAAVRLQRACVAACEAPAAALPATVGERGWGSWHDRRDRGRCVCADSRSADTAPTAPASARSPAHPSQLCAIHSATPTAPLRAACRPAAPRPHVLGPTPLVADGPARSPFFCSDLLHHLDLEVGLRHPPTQRRDLRPAPSRRPVSCRRWRSIA